MTGLVGGVRSFEKRLDLEPDAAVGLRVGLGINKRVTVLLEYVYTAPARKTGGASESIFGLRGLAQARLTAGPLRPYLLAGIGGVFFNFNDTSDTAAGAIIGGFGIEARISPRVSLVGEASGDFYRFRRVTYSETGTEVSSTDRSTDAIASFLGGLQVTF